MQFRFLQVDPFIILARWNGTQCYGAVIFCYVVLCYVAYLLPTTFSREYCVLNSADCLAVIFSEEECHMLSLFFLSLVVILQWTDPKISSQIRERMTWRSVARFPSVMHLENPPQPHQGGSFLQLQTRRIVSRRGDIGPFIQIYSFTHRIRRTQNQCLSAQTCRLGKKETLSIRTAPGP